MHDNFIRSERSFPHKSRVSPTAQCCVAISVSDGWQEVEIHRRGRKVTNKQMKDKKTRSFAIYLSCLLEGGACVMTDVGDGMVG